jgi:steroid Delta-isomerase
MEVTMDNAEAAARRIYEEWHAGFNEGNLDRVMAVYAENAVIETPTVLSMYPEAEEGILRGRDKIRELFARNLENLKRTFSGLYRNGLFFSNGKYLTWEYPRVTPTSTQVDLFESMDIADGLCVYHRVYWGWRGMKALIENRKKLLAERAK